MAEKDPDLQLSVGAVADKKSAEQAAKDITKQVESSVKGGRIEVPVDITVPIDKTKSELTKAQKDITTEIDKISKSIAKGFSASGKDIDKLTSKFNKFMDASKAAGKDNRNPIVKAINQQVKSLQQQNKELVKAEKATRTYEAKVNKTTKNTKSKSTKYAKTDHAEQKERDDKKFVAGLERGASRARATTPGADVNLGIRSPNMDSTFLNKKKLQINDKLGTYYGKNSLMKQAGETEKLNRKQPVDIRIVDIETANKMADEAIAKGGNKNQFTEAERAKGIASAILPELAKVLGGIEKGRDDSSPEKFFQMLEAVLKLNQDAGMKALNNAMSVINMTMHKWFNTDGVLGVGDGTDKIDATRAAQVEIVLKDMLKRIDKLRDNIIQETKAVEETYKLEKQAKAKRTKTSGIAENSLANKVLTEIANNTDAQNQKLTIANKTSQKMSKDTEKDYIQNLRESSMERAADTAESEKNKIRNDVLTRDSDTGLNTESNASKLIGEVEKLNDKKDSKVEFPKEQVQQILSNLGTVKQQDGKCPCQTILEGIRDAVQSINSKIIGKVGKETTKRYVKKSSGRSTGDTDNAIHLMSEEMKRMPMILQQSLKPVGEQALTVVQNALVPVAGTEKNYYEGKDIVHNQNVQRQRQQREEQNKLNSGRMQRSMISTTVKDPSSFITKLKDAFADLTNTTANYEKIMQKTSKEQDDMAAKRIKEYGINRGNYPAESGDKISFARSMSLWRGKDKFADLFKGLNLSEGVKVDTTAVTDALAKVLSGKEMFDAQTGGAWRNLLGSMTGYIGMPSLEKSRAQAEGLNQIMANIRKAMNDILNDISNKESAISSMEASGDLKYNADGTVAESSTVEAKTLVAQLEESKLVLASILADAAMVDETVDNTEGKISEIVKQLGFTSPVLRENNSILANINAGLDKNGKALKFQTRTGEVLNYSFQLLARHIGQIVKNWMMMLNPINLIKKAFSDFASYDTKWQRTMNVIKYNFRRIIRPAMEWIAQQFVNIIGLANSLLKGLGKAFGQNWDLFDQDAANAEKIREELEAASNVSAGFDELHDIGSDNTGANDLLGDIYTPQWESLNKIIEDFGEKVGSVFKKIKDLTEGWNFWNWLALIGGALAGFLVLKWLLGLFGKGKNPLQSVADGLSFLEKAVGWAILIWALTEFTKALTDFVDCMKTANWEDIVKSLLMLGGAFAELFLTAGGLLYLSSALSISAPSIAAIGAVVGGLALFTVALTDFIECMKSASWEDIVKSLLMLAGAFAILVLAGGGLMVIASALGMLAPQMLGLAVVIAAFAPVIWALSAFVEAIKGLTTEDMINGLLLLAGAFTAIAIAIGVLLVVLSAAIASGVGALAILALAGVLAVVSLVILALAELVRAMGEAGEGIKLICEGIATIITAIGEQLTSYVSTIGEVIVSIINAISTGIKTVLEPILEFIDSVIGKVLDLAGTIAHEIGETIRTVIETVGEVILGIVDKIVNAIPNLLKSIVNFCNDIGPAIENTVDAICRSITKLVNFVVSAVEYMANLVIGAINKFSVQVPDWVPGIGGSKFGFNLQKIEIPRFVPQYAVGTNFVPNDGLAYLHKGEAVIPKKYNQPYTPQDNTKLENSIDNLTRQVEQIGGIVNQGIKIQGQFVQRGSDLVATVEKARTKNGNQPLNNPAFAR